MELFSILVAGTYQTISKNETMKWTKWLWGATNVEM
jgi:hypothetical protein